MAQPKIKYQQFSFVVPNADFEAPIDFETDKLYKKLSGINVVLSNNQNKFSCIQLNVNSSELFPEKFEVLRVLFREAAPFGFDYHELNEPAGGSRIKGKYKDVNTLGNYPYTVTISLRLENE